MASGARTRWRCSAAAFWRAWTVLAAAMRAGVAKRYGIVGGEGHTTQALRDRVHGLYPDLDVRGMPEARLFAEVLRRRHGLEPDFLEEKSTNCGNNITYLLEVLRKGGAPCRSIVLAQDATMQRRMAAGLALHAPEVAAISFATYRVRAVPRGDAMGFEPEPEGMWDAARYISLLMGEILACATMRTATAHAEGVSSPTWMCPKRCSRRMNG